MAHLQWQARVRAEERCPYALFNVVDIAATPAVPFLAGTETPKPNISPSQIEAATGAAAFSGLSFGTAFTDAAPGPGPEDDP